jgi:hypothetical protein
MSLTVTVVDSFKNKVNRPNACFTTLCQSTDFDDQSNLSPIVPNQQMFFVHETFDYRQNRILLTLD